MSGLFIEVYSKDMSELMSVEIDEALIYEVASFNWLNNNYSIEVIKALTVLKRSQLVKEIKNSKYAFPSKQALILDKSCYEMLDKEKQRIIIDAVASTRGIIAVCGNKAVDLFVTECCGGGTTNSEDVLGYRINYLRRVLCENCTHNSYEKKFSIVEYAKKSNLKGLAFKDSMDGVFSEVERDDTGRIINISFLGVKMSGEEFAKMFGMESNRVYFMEDSVIFRAIGKGIGLGICIEGANNMAREGKNFKEIINYYYTGVTFEDIDEYKLLKTLRDKKIIVDPGHGGKDRGNINEGIEEKTVNLKIGLLLMNRLQDKGATVMLTRDNDVNISLSDRVEMINRERPELYISIHQNYFAAPGVNGVECYCYNRDEEALKLGSIISREISNRIGVKDRGTRTGDYFLLRECKVSGVMVECMYISGNQDITKYNEDNFRNIAAAIYESICIYYNITP
ncbi:MAG: N-acetylmuramoyl-L-alanine amidase [Clostridiales bacterium]|jgi:SpoIID/LytB domain protein|nr:N-acetylmuramoyl-L-alanine amidase [Clostridiales bacterium]